jgi:hypothetical protein
MKQGYQEHEAREAALPMFILLPPEPSAEEEDWEVLRRLRNGGSQFVRVEHVHVHEGGQAVIGNVRNGPDAGPTHAPPHGTSPVTPAAVL